MNYECILRCWTRLPANMVCVRGDEVSSRWRCSKFGEYLVLRKLAITILIIVNLLPYHLSLIRIIQVHLLLRCKIPPADILMIPMRVKSSLSLSGIYSRGPHCGIKRISTTKMQRYSTGRGKRWNNVCISQLQIWNANGNTWGYSFEIISEKWKRCQRVRSTFISILLSRLR